METCSRLLRVVSLMMRTLDLLSASISSQDLSSAWSRLLFNRLFTLFSWLLFSSCLHHLSNFLLLVFILCLLECEDRADGLMHHLDHLLFLRLVLMVSIDLDLEQSTLRLPDRLVSHTERRCPPLDLTGLLVVYFVIVLHTRVFLIRLAVIVLKTILQLGISLRGRIIFEVIDGVGGRIDLAMRDSPYALL